jgi:NAD-dependent deacetylase
MYWRASLPGAPCPLPAACVTIGCMESASNMAGRLARLIQESDYTLVFTGAGISTGSGIPDFRGPKGLWRTWKPVYYNEFMTSREARIKHWEFKASGWRQFRDARPNAGHLALAALDRMGYLQALVTQNIDGLHQLAGHPEDRVIELHGTNRLVECQTCKELTGPEPAFRYFEQAGEPPLCHCGGFLKPATVSFGQAMPLDKMERAVDAARRAKLAVSIGSTLEVEPAASVTRIAKSCGAKLVIINQGETAQDHLADLRSGEDAQLILPAAVEVLKNGM